MPKVKKLPEWAIRQAGGINKKAWALARRGKTSGQRTRKGPKPKPRKTPRHVGRASHSSHRNSKPGWGRIFKMGRTIDIFSGPAQGSVAAHGFTRAAGDNALDRYSGGMSKGRFNPETAKATAGGIGTGLLRDWIRSKMGIYRGLGQKKILSGVMAANPEILATSRANPLTELDNWNVWRQTYDRGYNPRNHTWISGNDRDNLIQSIGLDAALKITQKVAEIYINPMLPPGHNL